MSEVKIRADGMGDKWANSHRDLGPTFNMTDVDGLIGLVGFAANTGDRLFVEYIPDNYVNRASSIRQFSWVALFDRKISEQCATSEKNAICTAFYLHACRTFAEFQPKPPRFYWVIGSDIPPWTMIDVDIYTGKELGRQIITGQNWRDVWQAFGLENLRTELRQWIDRPTPAKEFQ